MGTRTPNMSIYKPAPGETVYDPAFAAGQDNTDSHDHTGGPTNGVQLGTEAIQDGAITPDKLSVEILSEATVQTTDGTATEIASVAIAESSGATVSGRYIGLKSDATECVGGNFIGVFHRPTSSSVQVVSVPSIMVMENSSGAPSFQMVADTGNETVSLRVVGEAAKTIDWHVTYNSVAQPEPS